MFGHIFLIRTQTNSACYDNGAVPATQPAVPLLDILAKSAAVWRLKLRAGCGGNCNE